MEITRNNYEGYFLDFVEGKLDDAMKRELEQFLAVNPDLKNELEQFENLPVSEGNEIKFHQKSFLKKEFISSEGINEINYENFLIGKIEGALNKAEEKKLELFISKNPFVEKELNLFKKTILKANFNLVFQNKKELKKIVVRRIQWQHASAALAIAASVLLLLYLNFAKEKVNQEMENEIVQIKDENLSGQKETNSAAEMKKAELSDNQNYQNLTVTGPVKIMAEKNLKRTHLTDFAINPENINEDKLFTDNIPPDSDQVDGKNAENKNIIEREKANKQFPEYAEQLATDNKNQIEDDNGPALANSKESESNSVSRYTDEGFTLKEFLAFSFKKNVLNEKVSKKKKDLKITPVELAFAAVKGISKLFGSRIKVDRNYHDNGELASLSITSPRVEVTRTLNRK